MNELLPEFPKYFTEDMVRCFCHVESNWAVSRAKPAATLCPKCRAFLTAQQKLYGELTSS